MGRGGGQPASQLDETRVALDESGSGTLVNARLILAAYGVKESDIKPDYIKPNQAGDKMKDGSLDAFFFVGGAPAGAIAELASSGAGIELIPIDGPQVDTLLENYRFFAKDVIPAGTYDDVPETPTVSVGAQWVVAAEVDEDLSEAALGHGG